MPTTDVLNDSETTAFITGFPCTNTLSRSEGTDTCAKSHFRYTGVRTVPVVEAEPIAV